MLRIHCLLFTLILSFNGFAQDAVQLIDEEVLPDHLFPSVKLQTSKGEVTVELDRRRAPVTVNNFLRYVESDRYDGTVFHRVIKDFVVQGGGYKPDFSDVETFGPIVNESGNGLKNRQWSIAMARHDDPHSATSQFYFNLSDNENLDPSRSHWGYTVFGKVVDGRDVLTEIANVKTHYDEALDATDVPSEPIVLESVEVLPSQF